MHPNFPFTSSNLTLTDQLPPHLYQLESLEELNVSDNRLAALPEEIGLCQVRVVVPITLSKEQRQLISLLGAETLLLVQ